MRCINLDILAGNINKNIATDHRDNVKDIIIYIETSTVAMIGQDQKTMIIYYKNILRQKQINRLIRKHFPLKNNNLKRLWN